MSDRTGGAVPVGFERLGSEESAAAIRRMADEAAARRETAVAMYGPERTALAPCVREEALRQGGLLLLIRGGEGRAPSLMGWTGGPASTLPPEVRRQISTAVRMPGSVAATWAEHQHWQARADVLAAFDPEADQALWVRARRALLEERLDTLPARDREDVLARLSWMGAVRDLGFSRPIADDETCLATLRQDIEGGAVPLPEPAPGKGEPEAVAASPAPPAGEAGKSDSLAGLPDPPTASATVQPGHRHRSRDEARQAVRALLGEGLPDHEIARGIGVSPSTVAAVRRAAA